MAILAAALLGALCRGVWGQTPGSVIAAMDLANGYFTGRNPPLAECGWTRGTYFAGAIAHYRAGCEGFTGCNASLLSYISAWAASHNYSCGGSINANDEVCGATYVELYELDPQPSYLALRTTLDGQVANPDVGGWNWVDALFMGLPTWMRFANVTGDSSYAFKAYEYFLFTAYADGGPGLWSPEHNLFYRDATYFNKTSPGGHPIFWARGVGWALAAMARAIAVLPADSPFALEFTQKLVAIAGALLPLQNHTDGFWRASLLDAASIPNPETTGTALFVYGIAWGITAGILPQDPYLPAAFAGWNALASVALQPDGFVGWCQPANGQPAPTVLNSTSDFCVGQFLLAGSEILKLTGARSPSTWPAGAD